MSYLYNKFGSRMGRAWGMAIYNLIGGCKPNDNYQGNIGNPANDLPVVFGELEEWLPTGWNPLHVQKGFNLGDSTVTCMSIRHYSCGMTLRGENSAPGVRDGTWDWQVKETVGWPCSSVRTGSRTLFIDPHPVKGFINPMLGDFQTKEELSQWVMDNMGITKYNFFDHQGVINYALQQAIHRRDDTLAHWYYDLDDDDLLYPVTNVGVVVIGGSKNIRWHCVSDGAPSTPGLISDWE
jgi:hypothetical protein